MVFTIVAMVSLDLTIDVLACLHVYLW